jgi:hypothetical protein
MKRKTIYIQDMYIRLFALKSAVMSLIGEKLFMFLRKPYRERDKTKNLVQELSMI